MSDMTPENVIDFIIDHMDINRVVDCIDDLEYFYTINDINGHMYDLLEGHEDHVFFYLMKTYQEHKDYENLMLEDEQERMPKP